MPDPTRNTLLVARELLRRADAASDGTAAGAMAALILYDAAVETGSKAILGIVAPNLSGEVHLPQVLDRLASEAEESADSSASPSAIREARALRRLRNTVQHDGRVPSNADLDRARHAASTCLSWATREFFGIEFSAITRSGSIDEEGIRGLVIAAEEAAREGNYQEGLAALAKALDVARGLYALRPRKTAWFTANDFMSALEVLASPEKRIIVHGRAAKSAGKVVEQMLTRLEQLEQAVDDVAANFDRAEYAWFQRVAPHVWRNINGEWHVDDSEAMREVAPGDFDRAHGFVVDSILRIESWVRARDR